MIYTGRFKDINNVDCTVYIGIDKNGADKDIILSSDNPVVIEYKGGDYFKPFLCSTATIKIVTNEQMFELNDTRGDGVKVTILKGGSIFWCGFATPNAYTQSFDLDYNVYELECQDALSTLSYRKYKPTPLYKNMGTVEGRRGNEYELTEQTSINPTTNLLNVIFGMLNSYLKNIYTVIYFPDSLYVPQAKVLSLIEALFIDERNFFDEDGQPWKCLDVIAEICKILGVTCVPFGYALYFLHYDAIAKGMNAYHKYVFYNQREWRYDGIKTLESTIDIAKSRLRGGGVQITLSDVYNAAKVKCDLYAQESLIADYKDNSNIVTSPLSNGITDAADNNTVYGPYGDGLGAINTYTENNKDIRTFIYLKYLGFNKNNNTGKQFKFYHYPKDREKKGQVFDFERLGYGIAAGGMSMIQTLISTKSDPTVNDGNLFSYQTTKDYVGACFVDYDTYKASSSEIINYTVHPKRAIFMYFDSVGPVGYPYMLTNRLDDTAPFGTNDWSTKERNVQKLFSVSTDFNFLNAEQAIDISGAVKFFEGHNMLPITHNKDKAGERYNYIVANLSFAGFYWNGFAWQKEPINFYITLDADPDKNAFGTAFNFKSIHNEIFGFESKNYCVPMRSLFARWSNKPTKDDTLNGKVVFSLFRPQGVTTTVARSAILTDFDIKVIGMGENGDSDIQYSNVVNEDAIKEYPNIECKISSATKKGVCYSNLYYIVAMRDDNGNTVSYSPSFVQPTDVLGSQEYNLPFHKLLSGRAEYNKLQYNKLQFIYDKSNGIFLHPEQHIIERICNQHYTPTLEISTAIRIQDNVLPYSLFTYDSQFDGFKFTLNQMSYDIADDKCNIKVINKKE